MDRVLSKTHQAQWIWQNYKSQFPAWQPNQVQATLQLLYDDCTLPFIARYRKEGIGYLDEVAVARIAQGKDLYADIFAKQTSILEQIASQNKLTPELESKISNTWELSALEDLYLPYKKQKTNKLDTAKKLGLEPLAKAIWESNADLIDLALEYLLTEESLTSTQIILNHVAVIVQYDIAYTESVRQYCRQWIAKHSLWQVEFAKDAPADKIAVYENYKNYQSTVDSIPAYAFMALTRGEKEGVLHFDLVWDKQELHNSVWNSSLIQGLNIHNSNPVPNLTYSWADKALSTQEFIQNCAKQAIKSIVAPSIETEIRSLKKEFAEEAAITVFQDNLQGLLLQPASFKQTVLAVDPGIRTGCKIVVLDAYGDLMGFDTIKPSQPGILNYAIQQQIEKLLGMLPHIDAIVIGNGTAGRETRDLFYDCLEKSKIFKDIPVFLISEAGASVYSASEIAREEFPDLDISYRGAVSIGRRFQDPLAELVKIDPKSIGVGQYQHDVPENKLEKSLRQTVEHCVNTVGVNLNTASYALLSYVSGLSLPLAKKICQYRKRKGGIGSRHELLEIPGIGPKTFEQSAGFLRVPESACVLDNTSIHPEQYNLLENIANILQISLHNAIILPRALLEQSKKLSSIVSYEVLYSVVEELQKTGRDPRGDRMNAEHNREIRSIDDLAEGMIVQGTVTNVTQFGAFVDIGVKKDGLIHVSQLANRFVKTPSEVVAVGQSFPVKVLSVDKATQKISLSKKQVEGV
jgi:protein Tex